MYSVKKNKYITKRFRKILNPNKSGSKCMLSECGKFIDYREEIYINGFGIVLCKECKEPAKKKYRNIPKQYSGVIYDSKKEAEYAKQLDWRLRAGNIKSWERQKKISIDVNGKHICNYYCDFLIIHPDGSREYVEIKSDITETPLWRIKWKLFEANLDQIDPGAILTVVK